MKVGVSGAGGRMGSLTAATIDAADDMHLIALYDPHTEGSIAGLTISRDRDALDGCDIVVEFSRPEVVMGNLAVWRSFGANVVVGSSGFDTQRLGELDELWANGPGNCLIVPNFSIGAVLMMTMAEMAAPHFPVAEVVEMHHDEKADAPSGTAIATAQRIAAVSPHQMRQVASEELHDGALGADIDNVRVHSVRLPGAVAHQTVMFGGEGERLSITHDTSDRSAFMPGVLLAVRSIPAQKEPLAVGLETLLGI
ncbi:MAG: 4-hydroxy-tetrahydrodipicolinate reductase [Acidimicrobiia bacterium]|nr:MAG: 4-hydroxy-tetrahydrodipicolinate reductase [Acidimicrobiia bacterium]